MLQEARSTDAVRAEVVTRIVRSFRLDEYVTGDGLDIEPNGSVPTGSRSGPSVDQGEDEDKTKPMRPRRRRQALEADYLTGPPHLSWNPEFLDPVA